MKKRGLSLLLAILMVASVFSPAFPSFGGIKAEAATDAASNAYATVITASDFQDGRSGNLHEEAFSTMLQKAKAYGLDEPNGFILGGDYDGSYANEHSTPIAYHRVESVITSAYPYYNKKNIVGIQGNHDVNDPSVIDKTGPHEYDDYIVYVINNDDYPAGTGGKTAYNRTMETNDELVAYFNQLKAEGDTRPIFIATHIPLHHNSRNPKSNNKDAQGNVVSTGYNETLYSRVLFETLNEQGKTFDIIFLFGHNHSGVYDDYIGGSVNYLGKGDTIRIPDYNVTPSETSYTEETLNFTYMNYGYVGYSNSVVNNTLTMNTFEICPDKIVATRFSTTGKYGEAEIIDRNMKSDVALVTVEGDREGTVGSVAGAIAIASGVEDPVYTWASSNEGVASVSYSDRVARITYNSVGTATIRVRVAERNNPSKNAVYTYNITVSENTSSEPNVAIYRAKEQVDGKTLEYYQITLGDTVALSGKCVGLTENTSISWSSSNTGIAKVNQYGLVTFVGIGTANITYTATINGVEHTAQVKLVIGTENKVQYKYIQTNTITAGKSYVLASDYSNNNLVYSDRTENFDKVTALSGVNATFNGSAGSYQIQLNDDAFVWNAVRATSDNQVYLQNSDSGLYLAAYATGTNDDGGSTSLGYFELTKAKPSNGIWQIKNGILQTTDDLKWYPRSGKACNITSSTGRGFVLFEQVALDSSVNIEFSGEAVNGTTQTVYLAVNGRQIELGRDCVNIQKIQSEKWTSSNTDVATIDNNGVVTFKGVNGNTVITYTATDAATGRTVTASFTISAVLTAEATRLFKYTETVVPGRKYLIVNSKDAGHFNAFSSFEVTYTRLLADRIDVIVEDGASYVEIPDHLTDVVWVPETAGGSSFYLKNEGNGKYLYANSDGTYDDYDAINGNMYTSDSYGTNTVQYTWTYENGSKLYNNFAYTDSILGAQTKTYVRMRSAEFLGIATADQSNAYFFEEIAAKPKAVITSRFEILGEEVERTEICPFQTETFLPTAQNFPDNSKVSYAWSSDNTSIATVEQNGVVTYTGKAGKVTITLTATSQVQDSTGAYPKASSSVTIEVIGGVGYVDPPGTTYTENAFYKTTNLVPGKKYVMHTSYSDAPNLAIGNVNRYASPVVRLDLVTIDAPATDENGEYIATTNQNIIWECLRSDVDGYVYLYNSAYNNGAGGYLYMHEDTSTIDNSPAGVTGKLTDISDADAYLLRFDSVNGVITSKALDEYNETQADSKLRRYLGNTAYSSSSGGYRYIRTRRLDQRNEITLYGEPGAETGKPVLEKFELTDKLVDGQKFILRATTTNEGGSAISLALSGEAATGTDEAAERLMGVSVTPVDNIITTDNHNIIWIAEASGGYFYLRNYETNEYLAIFATGNLLKTTSDKTANNLLRYYEKSTGNMCFSLSTSNNSIRYKDGAFYESSSGASFELYAYTGIVEDEPDTPTEIPEVITQIRKQEEFGSTDITRSIEYRYAVYNGSTERFLRYIRGVSAGYTTAWSTSDATIATIDQNGLLAYTGKSGYVDVYLTITGTDFAGNDITRTIKTTINVAADNSKTRIAVPETVYMTPASGASTVGQIYVNNVMDPNNSYDIKTIAAREDNMYFGLRVVGAKSFTVSVSNATNSSNDINLYTSTGALVSESENFSFNSEGVFESDEQYSLRFSGAGLQPGEKATAKWEITVTMNDGTTKQKHTLYTVMYAPERTVGAVAEARQVDNSQNEISSWITGINGVDHSKWSPLGSLHADKSAAGYFKADPLYNQNPPTNSTGETATDLINVVVEYPAENTNYANAYVVQTATNGNDDSTAKSYLGLLTVDKSRYTNTNQIPNLKIGYDALRRGDWTKDSFHTYANYYTLGTSTSFTSTDPSAVPGSDWIQERYFTNFAESHSIPERYTLIPSYNVSDIDGKYIHVLNKGQAIQDFWLYQEREYSTAGTSVLCTVTDKSILRERVLSGYNITDGTTEFNEALKNAAIVLGDPAATQQEIDKTSRELYEAMAEKADTYYALKYDNLFSAFEYSHFANSMTVVSDSGTVSYLNGTITVENGTITGGEAYTNYGSGAGYYLVDLKPNTEYVFEYYVTTNLNAQAFMFFYNSSGGNSEAPTNMSVKVNDGAWNSKSESNAWWGNYTYGAGTYHYAIKFTTGPNTVKASFRFGNTSNDPTTSTFSSIKLIDSAHYYEDAQYSKTESIHKEYTAYGSLIVPERPGYLFLGWQDENGITVTGANSATENLTIYSQWKEVQYNVHYDGNFGAGSKPSEILTITKNGTTPTSAEFTRDNHTLLGWSFNADATTPDFGAGQTITVADVYDHINSNNQATLYAVWERNYSVYYSPNEGTGTVAHTYNPRSQAHILPDDSTISRDGYEFLGWALTPDATEPDFKPGDKFYVGNIDQQYVNETKQEVILHAVWAKIGPQNVTFDNLVDISAWSNSVGSGTIVNDTDTGFTVKSNEGAGEATCSSAYFPVTAGHKYVIEADIKGDNWDIYIFFCDANGTWIDFDDAKNRLASYGLNQTSDGIHVTSNEFTAPAGAVKVQLRVDANGSNNAVRFENIRAYDTANTTYLETVNKYVEYGEAYGKLPVPVKDGQQFLGWVDEKGNTVTADSIMNSTSTVFLKSTWTTNPNTVNDDTVVIEYGLPVVINVLSNDKAGSVVNGVGTKGLSEADLGSRGHASTILTDKASNLTLANGNVKLNADGTITYTPTKTNATTEEVFYYEVSVDGKIYYAKVTVIPATTIYFEDTFFTFENSSVTKNGTTYNYNWEEVGTSVGEVFQTSDRPGQFNFRDDANNVYGFDSSYDGEVSYSGGTAHFVEVDQIAGAKVPKAIFTFTGTGFDLFSATDDKSGTITTTIYRGTAIDSTKRVQGIMTNAYFGYAYDDAIGDYVPTSNGALFQVPVIRARDLSYDTYTVVVEPRYNKSFDVAGTGECGVYVDSVRIYDPMGGGNAIANEAYKADGEYAPQFLEIRDTLVKSKGDGTFDVTDLGQSTSVFLDGGKTSLEDFAKLGPKNEVYLGQNDAVTFHIVTDRPELPSTIQIGMSLTGKGGSSANVKLMNTDYNSWVENITLNSTSERYYNIEAVVDWVEQPDGTFKTAAPVIVTNTSAAIISLTSIKWAFDNEDSVATVLDLVTDEMTPRLALAALNRALDPEVTPQQTMLNKENITFEFTGEPYAQGDSGILTITTEQGVSGVTVNGTDVFNCEINSDGKLEWIFEFDADSAGSMTFEIIARDEEGFTSESIYATTNVESDVEDGTDEPVIPDDGGSDDNTGDSGNNNVVTGPESFVTTLLNGIFNIIRKILGLILGGATV